MRLTHAFLSVMLTCLTPGLAAAQDEPAPRGVVFGEVGYARTWDDEGLLGSGASLGAGIGFRVSPRTTIQAIFERIPYHRDAEHLVFDGRVLFVGAEAAFQSTARTVRPFATIGAGLMMDDGLWTRKAVVEEQIDRSYQLAAMTASGGIDFAVSKAMSIRASLRFHGLLDTGDDLAPHIIIQPGIGVAWRW